MIPNYDKEMALIIVIRFRERQYARTTLWVPFGKEAEEDPFLMGAMHVKSSQYFSRRQTKQYLKLRSKTLNGPKPPNLFTLNPSWGP